MKPKTIPEAFTLGYSIGNDSSGMMGRHDAWPSEADFEKPDALVSEWLRGWSLGYADQDSGEPVWATEEYV